MKFLIVLLMLATVQAHSATKMGPEAVEMFHVLNHPQVRDCLDRENLKMVNVEIEKIQARCQGCNTYKISGNIRKIDIISAHRSVIKIVGKMERGAFNQPVQTYTCSAN